MSNWEKIKKGYTTQFPPTSEEKNRIPICFFEAFAANKLGTRTLFALFNNQVVSKIHNSWTYDSTGQKVSKDEIVAWFPNNERVENLNFFTGTAQFEDKSIYLSLPSHMWKYLNNRTVHFNGSQASEEDHSTTESEDDSEDDTARVNELLQAVEEAVTSATEKLASLPGTPQLQESSLSRVSRPHSPEQQVPTPPVSKGKQRVPPPPPRTVSSSPSQTTQTHTPPMSSGPSAPKRLGPKPPTLPVHRSRTPTGQPPPAGNPPPPPPPPAPAMAQAHQPRLLGTAPESFNGSADKAIAFWNMLENYYTANAAVYDNEDKKISAALTHFKLGTQAGEWASDRMATALAAAPQTYGTWANFKADFKAQFIPPQTQLDAITKIHNLPMGGKEFNVWYQEWSQHARRSQIDEATKMYAFRKNLNPSLYQKIIQITPQPTTLAALVDKARDLDRNWCLYGSAQTSFRGS
jgi:hypothetical protein